MNFQKFIKNQRIKISLTLRAYCKRFGYDPAYISRLETGKLKPPLDKDKLEALAKTLQIEKDSSDWVTFFDLAYQSRSELPSDIKENASEIISVLPAFLRTADNKKVNKEKVKKLLDFLTNGRQTK